MKNLPRIVLLAALCCAMWMPAQAVNATRNTQSKIQTPKSTIESPRLQRALESALPGATLRVIVRLRDSRPSLLAAGSEADNVARAGSREAMTAWRRALAQSLQRTAEESQANLRAFLSRPDIAPQISEMRPFWIFNGMALRATPEVIKAIAARDDVMSIGLDEWRQWIEAEGQPFRTQNPESRIQNTESRIQNPESRIQNAESRIRNTEYATRNTQHDHRRTMPPS